jgi:SAM-dependent methyltransferase
MVTDRERWNTRYAKVHKEQTRSGIDAPGALLELAEYLPDGGSVADLAGGLGDAAIWMAERGLDATLVEVSDRACAIGAERAEDRDLPLKTIVHDLAVDGIPGGPWDALTCFHYLDRALLGSLHDALKPGGVALIGIATITNLERHERPSARFLLERDELPGLLHGLEIIHHVEDWAPWGYHEARVAARRPA